MPGFPFSGRSSQGSICFSRWNAAKGAADSVYGVGEVENTLRRAGRGYVLGVNSNHWFGFWNTVPLIAGEAKDIAQDLSAAAWQRLSAGLGTKGERLYDWAYCPLADLDAEEFGASAPGPWTRGLLIRRSIADGECAYFTTWCPHGTPINTLVRVEGTRWRIEEEFETAKNELGLDHNETRSLHGWHRHVSLVMLAYAMMAAVRYRANTITPKKTKPRTGKNSSDGPPRKSGEPRPEARSTTTSRRTHPQMVNVQANPSSHSHTCSS